MSYPPGENLTLDIGALAVALGRMAYELKVAGEWSHELQTIQSAAFEALSRVAVAAAKALKD